MIYSSFIFKFASFKPSLWNPWFMVRIWHVSLLAVNSESVTNRTKQVLYACSTWRGTCHHLPSCRERPVTPTINFKQQVLVSCISNVSVSVCDVYQWIKTHCPVYGLWEQWVREPGRDEWTRGGQTPLDPEARLNDVLPPMGLDKETQDYSRLWIEYSLESWPGLLTPEQYPLWCAKCLQCSLIICQYRLSFIRGR